MAIGREGNVKWVDVSTVPMLWFGFLRGHFCLFDGSIRVCVLKSPQSYPTFGPQTEMSLCGRCMGGVEKPILYFDVLRNPMHYFSLHLARTLIIDGHQLI